MSTKDVLVSTKGMQQACSVWKTKIMTLATSRESLLSDTNITLYPSLACKAITDRDFAYPLISVSGLPN